MEIGRPADCRAPAPTLRESFWGVGQLADRRTVNPEVGGSSPPAPVALPMPDWHYKSKTRPAARLPERVSGTWTASFHCERGDFPANPTAPFAFALFIDGELVTLKWSPPEERNYDRKGGQL